MESADGTTGTAKTSPIITDLQGILEQERPVQSVPIEREAWEEEIEPLEMRQEE